MFCFVALHWAPRPFGGARANKNTTQGVFFCSGPGERQGKEKPRWAPARGQSKKKIPPRFFFLFRPWAPARGQRKKKTPPRVYFFCSGPGERQGKEKLRWAPARGQSKKKTPRRVVFFLLRPWAPARGQSKKKTPPSVFFFLLRPRGKAGEGEAPLGAGTGPEQKPRVCFFFFAPAPGKAGEGEAPLGTGTGPEQNKKNTTQGVCFFCCGRRQGKETLRWAPARGQSKKKKKNTTQGVVFFFVPAPGKGRGRRSPVGRRHGARAKKNTTYGDLFFFWLRPRRKAGEGEAPLGAGTGPEQKNKHHPGCVCVFFFAAAPAKSSCFGESTPCLSCRLRHIHWRALTTLPQLPVAL